MINDGGVVPDARADVDASDSDLSAEPATTDTLAGVLRATTHTPTPLPQLAVGDELRGRFRIDRLIGVGGMGAVYLATDRALERQVAIKLHHSVGGTARLQREAVAMARLAHPNVIAVFEVGEFGDQVFVAMEYIAGTTLRGWLGKERRSPRERIAVLLGAGAGLAAAHDAGLVHRDFKPENVLIGDDGRARVGDFGLARGSQSQDEPPVPDHASAPDHERSKLDRPLTRTGAVLGTPGYIAPEQALGGKVDARADQFAFCVVAWEALCGERPFTGANVAELVEAIRRGPRRPPRAAKLRPAIRRVLERGLAVEHAARYRGMHELLAALRGATRTRTPYVVGAVGLAAAISVALVALHQGAAPTCDDAGAEVATQLPRELVEQLRAAGGPFPVESSERVAATLDGFAREYRAAATHACRAARIERAWPDDLYRRSTACLAIRLRTAAALVTLAQVARADTADVVQQVQQMPVLDACVDPATLAAMPVPPTDPTQLEAVVSARARLDAAAVEVTLARLAPARTVLDQLRGAAVATEPSVAARIQLVHAGVLRAEDHAAASEQEYRDAYFGARAIDDVEVTLAAAEKLIEGIGEIREDHSAADEWIRIGLADARRARARAPRAAAAVYTEVARVRTLEDKTDEALGHARSALALVEGTSTLAQVDALQALGYAGCAAGQYKPCLADEDRALALSRRLLGPHHPRVGRLLASMALDLSDSDRDNKETLVLASEAQRIVDQSHDLSSLDVARTEISLASMLINLDKHDQFPEARRLFEDARARLVRSLGPQHTDVGEVESDFALLDNADGHFAEGAARIRRAIAIQEHAIGPTASRVGDSLYNLAATLRQAADYDEAFAAAHRAAEIFAARIPGTNRHASALVLQASIANLNQDPRRAYALAMDALALPVAREPVFARAWALMEAGRSLVVRRIDAANARALLGEARAVFDQLKATQRAKECEELIAKLARCGASGRPTGRSSCTG